MVLSRGVPGSSSRSGWSMLSTASSSRGWSRSECGDGDIGLSIATGVRLEEDARINFGFVDGFGRSKRAVGASLCSRVLLLTSLVSLHSSSSPTPPTHCTHRCVLTDTVVVALSLCDPRRPTDYGPMGSCTSVPDKAAQERSAEIDRQIEEDSRKFRKECKILLLGKYLIRRGSRFPPLIVVHIPSQALVNPERALSLSR